MLLRWAPISELPSNIITMFNHVNVAISPKLYVRCQNFKVWIPWNPIILSSFFLSFLFHFFFRAKRLYKLDRLSVTHYFFLLFIVQSNFNRTFFIGKQMFVYCYLSCFFCFMSFDRKKGLFLGGPMSFKVTILEQYT